MTGLVNVAAFIGAAVVATRLGVWLIERAHPPSGRFVEVDGWRQHVFEAGQKDAPAVVFLHGASCNLEDMRLAFADRMAARHRLVFVDRPGLGWSRRPSRQGSSPAYQAAVLRGVLDRLGIDRAIVVGHSWGGQLALAFALDHPDRVRGLVLLAPPTHPRYRRVNWFYYTFATPVAGWMLAQTVGLPFGAMLLGPGLRSAFLPQKPPRHYLARAASRLMLRPQTLVANAGDVAHLKAFLKRQLMRYPRLAPPTVIITGDQDNTVAAANHAMVLAAEVPHAKLVVLPGIGHMLHHDVADRIVAEVAALECAQTDTAR